MGRYRISVFIWIRLLLSWAISTGQKKQYKRKYKAMR